MRQRTLLGWIGVTGLVCICLWVLAVSPVHRIRSETQAEIKLGMTRQQVEDIFRVPPGDYGPGKGEIVDYGFFTMTSWRIRTDPRAERWLAGSCCITVCFDKDDRVNGIGGDHVYRPYENLFELICQQLRLKDKRPYPRGSWNQLFSY